MRNRLETEAKLYVQGLIQSNKHELMWSYILEFENSENPHDDRKASILKWKNVATSHCEQSPEIVAKAKELLRLGLRPADALHIVCAKESKADYFLTTDDKILNKEVEGIELINPIDFVRKKG
jgi:predicted nucleic acid-binding protein